RRHVQYRYWRVERYPDNKRNLSHVVHCAKRCWHGRHAELHTHIESGGAHHRRQLCDIHRWHCRNLYRRGRGLPCTVTFRIRTVAWRSDIQYRHGRAERHPDDSRNLPHHVHRAQRCRHRCHTELHADCRSSTSHYQCEQQNFHGCLCRNLHRRGHRIPSTVAFRIRILAWRSDIQYRYWCVERYPDCKRNIPHLIHRAQWYRRRCHAELHADREPSNSHHQCEQHNFHRWLRENLHRHGNRLSNTDIQRIRRSTSRCHVQRQYRRTNWHACGGNGWYIYDHIHGSQRRRCERQPEFHSHGHPGARNYQREQHLVLECPHELFHHNCDGFTQPNAFRDWCT